MKCSFAPLWSHRIEVFCGNVAKLVWLGSVVVTALHLRSHVYVI